MLNNHENRARHVLNDVAGLPVADRSAAIRRQCGGDDELLAAVEALIRSEDRTGSLADSQGSAVEPTMCAAAAPTIVAVAGEHVGQMIGRYKLLQLIGEGGFGTVWMAEQREPVKRRVALKIIKLGMDTKQVIARFEAERQALAMMDHPNIARVLDAGSTELGRPYFVMEYIKGVPILDYCDSDKLDTRARLVLFASVCHAIQHAHQKGIIHRDIKPSNVLVTMHDGVAVPKVIDFGIAKATSSELTTKTLFTEHRQMIGTPAYMSPEQAEMSGLDIDTRSDIYSLGVLLYELLTGTTPFAHSDLMSKGFGEMMRIIREVEPHKPSTRLSSLGSTAIRTAHLRHAGDTKKLGNILRGDLDWIVMKCLEKDRTRRYETANGLAADILSHLKDEPVTAGAPSTAYRLRKFVRRNRVKVVAGSVVFAVLGLGVIGTTAGMVWAFKEKDRADVEATRATLAAVSESKARVRAETISEFVTTALKSSDPSNAGGSQQMTVLGAMDNAMKDIAGGRFRTDMETEARLKSTIATVLENNGRAAEAEPLYIQALEMQQRLHPGDHADVATGLINLANVREALGRASEAEPLAVRALEMNKRLHPGDHLSVADSLNDLANSRSALGRDAEAEPDLVKALEIKKRLFRGDDASVALGLNNLATVLMRLKRFTEAEPLLVDALAMNRRLFKGDHPQVATSLNNLAGMRSQTGRQSEAEASYIQALEMNQRMFQGDHLSVATSLNNLAFVRRMQGRFAEAEPLILQALEMRQRLFKGDHADIATSLNNLANVCGELGRVSDAEPLYAQALAMRQRVFTGPHPLVAASLSSLANARLTLQRPAEAETLFAQALEVNQRLGRGDNADVATSHSNLARARQALGKGSEARQGFDEALTMQRRLTPNGSPMLARTLWRSASARMESGDTGVALRELEESVAMADRVLPAGHAHLSDYRAALAKCKEADSAKPKLAGQDDGG